MRSPRGRQRLKAIADEGDVEVERRAEARRRPTNLVTREALDEGIEVEVDVVEVENVGSMVIPARSFRSPVIVMVPRG